MSTEKLVDGEWRLRDPPPMYFPTDAPNIKGSKFHNGAQLNIGGTGRAHHDPRDDSRTRSAFFLLASPDGSEVFRTWPNLTHPSQIMEGNMGVTCNVNVGDVILFDSTLPHMLHPIDMDPILANFRVPHAQGDIGNKKRVAMVFYRMASDLRPYMKDVAYRELNGVRAAKKVFDQTIQARPNDLSVLERAQKVLARLKHVQLRARRHAKQPKKDRLKHSFINY
jgi:hypothetical protein